MLGTSSFFSFSTTIPDLDDLKTALTFVGESGMREDAFGGADFGGAVRRTFLGVRGFISRSVGVGSSVSVRRTIVSS